MRVLNPGRIGIWSVAFREGRKMKEPREKLSKAKREPTANSIYIYNRAGIQPRHYWEASDVTTAPFVLTNCSLFDYVAFIDTEIIG